jgi:glycosyltransferase involved in cell wall biosynthesis
MTEAAAFTLVDHRLGDPGGHHIRMAETFLESGPLHEAWGRATCTLDHPRLHRHFSPPRYRFPPPLPPDAARWRTMRHRLTCLVLLVRSNARYLREVVRIPRKSGSIWFAANTSVNNLPGLLVFAAIFRRQRVVCYFQSVPHRHFKSCGRLVRLLRIRNVRFVTEDETMSREISRALGQPVRALLFPLLPPRWCHAPLPPVTGARLPIRIAVLGMPRREKGFQWLPPLAAALRPELESGEIRLVVQTGVKYLRREKLEAENASLREAPGVELIEWTRESEHYLLELQRADAVLTPYMRSAYGQRFSWIPIEGMALGKPVLVTDKILAAGLLRQYGCGLFFDEGDTHAMAAAIRMLLERYPDFHREAVRGAALFRADNSPDRFFGELEASFRRGDPVG